MEADQLPNYGRGYVELAADPVVARRVQKAMLWPTLMGLLRGLGPLGLLQTMQQADRVTRQMLTRDWTRLEKPGCNYRPLLQLIIRNTALMQALTNRLGRERAIQLLKHLAETTAEKQIAAMFVSVDALAAQPNCFGSFKAYFKALHAAAVREGTHQLEIKEENDRVFAFDIKYCVWHEIAKEFGDAGLAYSACQGDDVFYPRAGARLKFRYTRTGTLATGAPVCDFRYERG